MSTDRFTEQYRQLVSDPEIRAALLADPKAALVTHFGEIVEGDYRIEVIEQRSDTITALIPAPPEPGTDPSTRLAQVSGRVFDLLHSTGVGGYVIPDARLMWCSATCARCGRPVAQLRRLRLATWLADDERPTGRLVTR